MTYMLLLNCALKLVEEIILYYDARSIKHQMCDMCPVFIWGNLFVMYYSTKSHGDKNDNIQLVL